MADYPSINDTYVDLLKKITENTGEIAEGGGGLPDQTGHGGEFLTTDGTIASWAAAAGGGSVTTVSVASANGFTGTVANPTTAPAITIKTSITGIIKGNGTAISAASAGTDYIAPGGALGTPASGTLTSCTGLPIGGLTGLGTGVGTALAINVGSAGAFVTFNGALGTPSSGTLTNCTGYTVGNISGLGTGVGTFLATPTSANLKSAVTDETGSGALVFGTTPTFTTSVVAGSASMDIFNTTATTVNLFGATTTLNLGASAAMVLNFGGGTTAAEFRFLEPSGSGTNYTAFKAVAQSANITYSLPATVATAGQVLTDAAGNGVLSWTTISGGGTPANPTASVGLTAVNGSASTYMRSDAAPALSVSIAPSWSGQHSFTLIPQIAWTSISAGASQAAVVNTQYYCTTFNSGITITGYTGTPANGTKVAYLLIACDGSSVFTFPSAQRSGDPTGTSTSITPTAGTHQIIFTYVNSLWYYSDDNVSNTVANGATGVSSFTAYAPIFGGTTSTGALQSGTVGTAGQVLTSNGAGALPTFQAPGAGTPANPTASVGLSAVNGSASTYMRSDAAPALSVAIAPTWTGVHTFSPGARSSGVAPYFTLTTPADTGQTAATEAIGVDFTTATRTWATTGTVANQREIFFRGKTYASAGASQTFTDISTVAITPPIAGTNAIFTRGHSLQIVDATSAASSITGAVVIAAALGTTATSTGIGNGNINTGGTLTVGGNTTHTGTLTQTGTSTFTGASTHNNAVTINGAAATTALTITNTARTSGVLPYIKWTIPTDTGQTASTESPGVQTVTGTRTWATTGTVATQREILFVAPTYASASASQTFTKAATFAISGAPIQGTNAIITNAYALWVQGGLTQLDGPVAIAPAARSSGAASYLTITTPADTAQTASTESIGVSFTAATRQWSTGALTTQREHVFAAPTYGFVGASTLTTAVNVDIADPIQGTNATLTNTYSLRAANVLFTGVIKAGSTPTTVTDSAGKVLSAALNTVAVAQGGTGATTAATANQALTPAASSLTESAGAVTIDWAASNDFSLTLNANLTTVTFSNAVDGQTIVVAITNTASNYTVTWGNSIKWVGGSQPVQTTGAKTDVWTITKIGSTYYGNVVQNFS